jgi:aspartyl-tRNA(Asn)/glutamyl-tRNA(Gln) amidotransferase subunit C
MNLPTWRACSLKVPKRNASKKDLNRILGFMEKLNELDTEGVEPLIYLSEEINVMRYDESRQTITQKQALKNAPKRDSDYFKVPKVLKNPAEGKE